jgi:hypothetical protein
MDDLVPLGEPRIAVRQELDERLAAPLPTTKPSEAQEWGMAPEQVAEAERSEALLSQWGGLEVSA